MIVAAVVTEKVHSDALKLARAVGGESPLPVGVLNAPLDVECSEWINRLWDLAEGALSKAYRDGVAAARPLIERISAQFSDMAAAVGARLDDIRSVILERLNTYLQASIDGALKRVRASVNVGGVEFKLAKVSVEQKIALSGSLKASLEELCEFVADGEIKLGTDYQ